MNYVHVYLPNQALDTQAEGPYFLPFCGLFTVWSPHSKVLSGYSQRSRLERKFSQFVIFIHTRLASHHGPKKAHAPNSHRIWNVAFHQEGFSILLYFWNNSLWLPVPALPPLLCRGSSWPWAQPYFICRYGLHIILLKWLSLKSYPPRKN